MTSTMALRWLALAAGVALAGALPAFEPPSTTVSFAPAVVERLRSYGEEQRAPLRGEVRDASHRVLTVVDHDYFARTLALGSSSLDPWADARLAIDQFGVKLAAACRDLRRG